MQTNNAPIVILGAGISGLSLAWVLKSLNLPFIILEKQEKSGGVIRGESLEGFTLDLGPQTFMLEPELKALINHLGLQSKLSFPSSNSKSKFIASIKENYLKEITKNPLSVFKNFIIKPKDLPFIFKDLFFKRTPKKDVKDISLQDLSLEIFGPHITEEVLAPAMVGIWASELKNLSTKCLFPAIFKAYIEGTSIIKAQLNAKRKKNQSQGKSELASLQGGLTTLINALQNSLDEKSTIYDANIESIHFSDTPSLTYNHKGKTKELKFSKLISTIPSDELEKVLETTNISKENANAYRALLKKITYSPMGILHSKIRNTNYTNKKSGFGLLIPPGHSKSLLGTIFTSDMFQERAPEGYTLFTSFVGGSIYPDKGDVRDPKNSSLALEELKQILNLSTTPEILKTTYWEKAIPQYQVGHDDLVTSLQEIEKHYPLLLHGNYLDGTSIPHQVRRSFVLGARVALQVSNTIKEY